MRDQPDAQGQRCRANQRCRGESADFKAAKPQANQLAGFFDLAMLQAYGTPNLINFTTGGGTPIIMRW